MQFTNGRAIACQVYPRLFCAQICLGLKEELVKRHIGSIDHHGLDAIRELMEVFEPQPHDDRVNMEHLYSGK